MQMTSIIFKGGKSCKENKLSTSPKATRLWLGKNVLKIAHQPRLLRPSLLPQLSTAQLSSSYNSNQLQSQNKLSCSQEHPICLICQHQEPLQGS